MGPRVSRNSQKMTQNKFCFRWEMECEIDGGKLKEQFGLSADSAKIAFNFLNHEVRWVCVFYKKQGVCVLLTAKLGEPDLGEPKKLKN